MIALLRAEWLKLRSTRTALGMLIAVLVVTVLPLIGLIAFLKPEDLESGGLGAVASLLVPLVLLVFGVLGMTNEYRHRTITYTYLVTPRRWQVMVVKLASYALIGFLTMAATLLIVYLMTKAGGAVRGVEIDAGGRSAGDYAREIVVAGLITSFGVALGALFRAQVVTVAGTLIWALVVEVIVAGFKPAVGMWLPFKVFFQVSSTSLGGSGLNVDGVDQFSRPTAFLLSLLYIGVVSVAAVLISLRRDVT